MTLVSPATRSAPGDGPRERFGLDAADEVVLWNDGLWDWLDAESVLHAVAHLSPERPRLRLVFMGTSSAAQARGAEQRARALARDLGLLVVCACGDDLAERVAREDLGAAVASEHPAALASRSARARGAAGRDRSRCGAATRCTWPLALC